MLVSKQPSITTGRGKILVILALPIPILICTVANPHIGTWRKLYGTIYGRGRKVFSITQLAEPGFILRRFFSYI